METLLIVAVVLLGVIAFIGLKIMSLLFSLNQKGELALKWLDLIASQLRGPI